MGSLSCAIEAFCQRLGCLSRFYLEWNALAGVQSPQPLLRRWLQTICELFKPGTDHQKSHRREGSSVRITIDVLDGTGPLDYSSAIDARHPLKVVRKLNEPSTCSFGVLRANNTAPPLLRNARMVITDDNGIFYFTGYLVTEPILEYLGAGTEGPAFCVVVTAISDEILLDKQALSRTSGTFGQPVSTLMNSLTTSAGGRINSAGVTGSQVLGYFSPKETEPWSKNAHALASSARASYRVLNGNLSLAPIGGTVHTMSEMDGTLQVNGLTVSRAKMLVNDVTVCGEEEPAAYVTELFQGDGTTAVFNLTAKPFATTGGGKSEYEDDFKATGIDTRMWQVMDPGAHLAVTGAGLTFNGGSGIEGQTYLTSANTLEVGGSLLLEAGGVILGAGSDGLLLSLCRGAGTVANCFAGFRVKQVSGGMYLVPIIGGNEAGAALPITAGHLYTLRLHIYCVEQQRVLESFYSVGDAGLVQFGGDLIPAAASVLMEVQESMNGIPAAAVVLYDGSIGQAPAVCNLVAASSTNLTGSLRSIRVQEHAPVWVRTAPQSGAWTTKRVGTNGFAGDCSLDSAGRVRFFTGVISLAGDRISVCYRTGRRSIARLSQQDSAAREEATGTFPGTSRIAGTLTRPKARSSADCENGALAVLNTSCSRAAAIEGRYAMAAVEGNAQQQGDVWPGDMLAITFTSGNMQAQVVVREVKLEVMATAPELLQYTIDFANDWARELSLAMSPTVAANAWIPQSPNVPVLGNLPSLSMQVAGGSIAVDAGLTPPVGGGFEVRRRDWAFGAGTDSDLVLRSPVQHFSIPRWAAAEQYYVRMYDGSNPPVYSRVSSAVFLNLPM